MGLFFILFDDNNRFFIIIYRIVNPFSCIRLCRYIGKHSLNFRLNSVYIDITYDNNTLQIGTIPLFIVISQSLVFEVHNYIHCTNWEAVCIFCTDKHLRKHFFLHTLHCTHTCTPFFIDNATFFIYLFRIECQVIRPVMKNEKTRVDSTWGSDRDIGNIIDCFINRSICVQIFTEFYTDTFQILFQCITGKVCGSVEAHVFKEVSQSTLVIFFLDRTHFLSDIEIGTVFGKCVFTDVIR